MQYFFNIFILLVFSLSAVAQHYDPANISRKAKKAYEKARESMMSSVSMDRANTVGYLQKAIDADPNYLDAYALLATIYERDRKYKEALPYFDQAYRIDSVFLLPAYPNYARAEAGTGNFAKALHLIEQYLAQSDLAAVSRKSAMRWKEHFTFGLNSLQEHIPFQPINLGDSINSTDPEYFPSLTIDQQTMIFTRNLHSRNEDFFISYLQPDGNWGKATPLTSPHGRGVNTSYNEGAQTISQDGKILIYAICNRPDGIGSCDIYYAIRADSAWSQPRNIGPPVNSPHWDSQPSLSPNNRDLYFVSNRPGGYGGSDIYVSHLQPDGSWGNPENLGEKINTIGNESSPFIHADGQTLYFASDGRPGIGGIDLYYVRKNLDGSWGEPHNLGYPINTIDHDGSIFVAADGKTAYFSSDRSDSRGKLDLYQFTLYDAARPIRTLFVQGYVYDIKTNKRLRATLDLIDLSSGKTLTRIPTDPDGSYLVTLPMGKNYAFNVSKQDYLFYSANFSLKDTGRSAKPFYINIGLEPIEVNARVTLENIFFDFDEYTLKPESQTELDRVVQLMKKNPTLSIQINGYTDSVGNAQHNQLLSQQRAQAVVDFLESKEIDPQRLKAKGFGASHPVASNETEESRALNRRTELEVTSK